MAWVALIVAAAGLVVLGAVAASGLGPLRSLRRSLEGLGEVREEAERLRRNLEVTRQASQRLRERRRDGDVD